jgi:hypothetical protein
MVRISKLKLAALSFALLISFGMIATSARVSALSGGEFQAGRIIDDSVMYDGNAMSAQEIQAFLNAKVPVCDTNGTQMRGNVTRAAHGTANGYPPPYTCLKDFAENTPTKAADAYCANTYFGGVKTAAQIIYDVSRACNVSQKALIVLLQKEQSLITDDWPWSIQYRAATGYGCPDTAACDAEYYGFFNQVYNASRQLQRYVKQSSYFNYRGGETSYIQYNPNAGCGGSNVYLQNSATAALYNYTPYQPNQAALDNLYGSGDGCSAYGNRNFWRLFNDWFGTTQAPNWAWQWNSQYAYTDETKTTPKDLMNLRPGDRVYVGFTARNTGNLAWSNSGANPLRVGTLSPAERSSIFAPGSGWLGASRPTTMKEATVAPGGIGTFEFWLTVPNNPGTYNERFGLLSEGRSWLNDNGLSFGLRVIPDILSWQWNSQYAYTDNTKTTAHSLSSVKTGEKVYVSFTAKNTGNVTWSNTGNNPLRVGTLNPTERISNFSNTSGWLGPTRPATLKETTVAPGGIGTFEFWITANSNGSFNERYGLLSEGKTWLNDTGLSYGISVVPEVYSWQWNSQYAYTDATKTVAKNLNDLRPGEKVYVGFTAKNTGNVTWSNTGNNPLRVGTLNPTERISNFSNTSGWLGPTRPATLKETTVAPGGIGTFEFWITANSNGSFNERYGLLSEGKTWLNDTGLSYGIRVSP